MVTIVSGLLIHLVRLSVLSYCGAINEFSGFSSSSCIGLIILPVSSEDCGGRGKKISKSFPGHSRSC
jgi:hypothetical protein